jgi:hypothetical protein
MFGTYCRLHVHVWASDREVIRAAQRKLKRSVRYARKHREARHAFYRTMLDYHHQGQKLVAEHRL